MKGAYLSQLYTDTTWTVVGLVIFFSFFLASFFWVYFRKGAKRHYEALAQFPLRNDGEFHE